MPWRAIAARFGLAAAALAVVVAAFPALIELAALAAVLISAEGWRALTEPAEIEVTEDALVTRTRLRRRRVFPWSSITELVCRPDANAPRSIRLLSTRGQVRLSNRTNDFALLIAQIRAHTPNASTTRSTRLRR